MMDWVKARESEFSGCHLLCFGSCEEFREVGLGRSPRPWFWLLWTHSGALCSSGPLSPHMGKFSWAPRYVLFFHRCGAQASLPLLVSLPERWSLCGAEGQGSPWRPPSHLQQGRALCFSVDEEVPLSLPSSHTVALGWSRADCYPGHVLQKGLLLSQVLGCIRI